jgi:formylglycine-generating enzyme required for sulfatase activity
MNVMNARELIEKYKAGRRNFKNLDLSGIDLSWAELSEIDVQGSDLEKARFSGATLVRANFSGSNLKHSDLSGTNLTQANLGGADLRGVNLRDSIWSATNYDSDTKFPLGFKPEDRDNEDQREPLEIKPLEKKLPDSRGQDSATTQKSQKSSQSPIKTSPPESNGFWTALSAVSGAVSGIASGITDTLSTTINFAASSSETLQSKSNLTKSPPSTPNQKQALELKIPGARPLELVEIPAGSFLMGSKERDSEQPIHKVTLKAFRIGKYPVTQGQYEAVMGKNPSYFKGADRPVERVNWHDAVEFCKKLSKQTGQQVSLASEAQWEYACRAGSTGKYCFGDDESKLGDYAWFLANSGRQTYPVGQKKPNGWGLYDMHGNGVLMPGTKITEVHLPMKPFGIAPKKICPKFYVAVLGTITLGTVVLPLVVRTSQGMGSTMSVFGLSFLFPEGSPLIPRSQGTSEYRGVVRV